MKRPVELAAKGLRVVQGGLERQDHQDTVPFALFLRPRPFRHLRPSASSPSLNPTSAEFAHGPSLSCSIYTVR